MYQYEDNHIRINNNNYDFKFNIRTVIEYKGTYIVLLEIPFDKVVINNIFCLDEHAKLLWQSEDLSVRYPDIKNLLPYEQMGIKDDIIYATDFYGRNYKINVNNGKVCEINIVK